MKERKYTVTVSYEKVERNVPFHDLSLEQAHATIKHMDRLPCRDTMEIIMEEEVQ